MNKFDVRLWIKKYAESQSENMKLKAELEQQKFNNKHNLSIDQEVPDRIKFLEESNKELKKIGAIKKLSNSIEYYELGLSNAAEENNKLKKEIELANKAIEDLVSHITKIEGE